MAAPSPSARTTTSTAVLQAQPGRAALQVTTSASRCGTVAAAPGNTWLTVPRSHAVQCATLRGHLGIGLACAATLAAGVAFAAIGGDDGRIGPPNRIQPSGRLLKPYGKLTGLGNLPAGGALTPDGRFMWTVSAGRGNNDVRIIKVAEDGRCPKHHGHKCRVKRARQVGKVVQVIPMPGAHGGMTIASDDKTAHV